MVFPGAELTKVLKRVVVSIENKVNDTIWPTMCPIIKFWIIFIIGTEAGRNW